MNFTLLFFEEIILKKIKLYSEITYLIAQLGLSLATAMMAAADFGVSMIVAPAYILSQRFTIFTFGQWNYILQGVLFIIFCLAIKKFRLIYVVSFVTCVLYGTVIDMWRIVIPMLNPNITPPGSMDLWHRIFLFAAGELLAAFSIMLFFKTYIYPQVCDLFVKGVSKTYKINQTKFKIAYDIGCVIISIALSLITFKGFVGIKIGTILIAAVNGALIGLLEKIYNKYIQTVPLFPKFKKQFDV